jgi:hypothetical protein
LGLISQELLVWADPDNRINYMIKFLSILLLTAAFPLHAQKKFVVVIGKIDFTSDALLELISASSEKARGIIDPNTRQFAFVVSTRSFKGFNSDLQREHFNEKYMESEKYPESTFVGTLTGSVNFKVDGVYQVYARGTLSVHGKNSQEPFRAPLPLLTENLPLTPILSCHWPIMTSLFPKLSTKKLLPK